MIRTYSSQTLMTMASLDYVKSDRGVRLDECGLCGGISLLELLNATFATKHNIFPLDPCSHVRYTFLRVGISRPEPERVPGQI